MKKVILAVLTAALVNPVFADDAPAVVRVSMELVKNGSVLWNGEVSAMESDKAPISVANQHQYVESCVYGEKGITLTPGRVTTGILAVVHPMQVNATQSLMSVSIDYSELIRFDDVKGDRGCVVQAPVTGSYKTAAQVKLKKGEKIELSGMNGADKYTFVVRSL